MTSPLDPFVPEFDARERFAVRVRASAPHTFAVAARFDLQSVFLVRAIFWLRTKLMRGSGDSGWRSEGFLTDLRRMGWGTLVDEPGRLFVAGASCQPWRADVVFTPRRADDFRAFAAPDQVKIAWTLEVEPDGPSCCRLITETRAVATDEAGRRHFVPYWRWARFGIVAIRWLAFPAIRKQAEAQVLRSASDPRAPGS